MLATRFGRRLPLSNPSRQAIAQGPFAGLRSLAAQLPAIPRLHRAETPAKGGSARWLCPAAPPTQELSQRCEGMRPTAEPNRRQAANRLLGGTSHTPGISGRPVGLREAGRRAGFCHDTPGRGGCPAQTATTRLPAAQRNSPPLQHSLNPSAEAGPSPQLARLAAYPGPPFRPFQPIGSSSKRVGAPKPRRE